MKTQTAQHTPGPWHLNTLETVLFSVHSSRGIVAEVSRGTMNEVGASEIEANARLIAAAPELFQACKRMEKFFTETPSTRRIELADLQGIACDVFQAIAKAQGGAL